ncbi:MAG: zinc ribbon domain-containing protein [Ruminococcus sp.]
MHYGERSSPLQYFYTNRNEVYNINYSLIITLVIVAILVLAVLIGVVAIKHKLRDVSRSLFGTNSFFDGINKQKEQMSETPRSLHAMTSIYLPQIMRDFPQFDYELYKNKAKSLLRSYFTAVQTKKTSALSEECSTTLKSYVQGIIEDMNARNVKQIFREIVIHDVQIARYIKTGATVTILFELSVGHYSYIEAENGSVVFGDKNLKQQSVYEVGLVYIQDAEKFGAAEAVGLNCPNCGAPITNLGRKFCEYCGTGIIEFNERVWKFDSVREQTTSKRQY